MQIKGLQDTTLLAWIFLELLTHSRRKLLLLIEQLTVLLIEQLTVLLMCELCCSNPCSCSKKDTTSHARNYSGCSDMAAMLSQTEYGHFPVISEVVVKSNAHIFCVIPLNV